jgi:hypothetical protein
VVGGYGDEAFAHREDVVRAVAGAHDDLARCDAGELGMWCAKMLIRPSAAGSVTMWAMAV